MQLLLIFVSCLWLLLLSLLDTHSHLSILIHHLDGSDNNVRVFFCYFYYLLHNNNGCVPANPSKERKPFNILIHIEHYVISIGQSRCLVHCHHCEINRFFSPINHIASVHASRASSLVAIRCGCGLRATITITCTRTETITHALRHSVVIFQVQCYQKKWKTMQRSSVRVCVCLCAIVRMSHFVVSPHRLHTARCTLHLNPFIHPCSYNNNKWMSALLII